MVSCCVSYIFISTALGMHAEQIFLSQFWKYNFDAHKPLDLFKFNSLQLSETRQEPICNIICSKQKTPTLTNFQHLQ